MKLRIMVLAAALLLAACGSKLSEENFAKVKEGMSEQEVIAILGTPAETNSVQILAVSGTSSTWKDDTATVSIQFVNGQVRLKSYSKARAAAK
ncbi:MAG: outer membrane protein assembly factor BamE [Burkholderiales bacterium]